MEPRRKLHLDISELARQRLGEIQLAYPFASQRKLATHILERALLERMVPSGLTPTLLPKQADDDA